MIRFLALIISVAAHWHDTVPVVFWGKLASNRQNVEVLMPIKGCLKKTTQVTLQGIDGCPPVGEVVIGGTIQSGNVADKVTLTVKCSDILANPSPEDRIYLAAQSDPNCKPRTCADGSTPLTCKPQPQVCGPQAQWPCKATKCEVNPCGCTPMYSNATSRCDDICPDRSSFMKCTENPCDYSSKDSLKCPAAATAVFCFPNRCGGCHAQWYDTYGRPVCHTPCSVATANFGKGKNKLGFGLVGGTCKAVSGKKAPVALFGDAAQCTQNCVCVDNGFADWGSCGADLGWTLVKGVCTQVKGCADLKKASAHTFFASQSACTSACPNPKVPVRVAGAGASQQQQQPMGPPLVKCQQGDRDCCPSGFKKLECRATPEILNETCQQLTCGSATKRTCLADECDGCSLQVLNDKKEKITAQCEVAFPNICTKVKCPNMGPPNCGTKPPQCEGFNIKCIKDPCACQYRWFSADMRPPSPQCAQALSKCFAPTDCPSTFECDPLPPNPQIDQNPEFKKQLICTQEQCSCRPVWVPPPYGLRPTCRPGQPGCCPDGLAPAQCSFEQAQFACTKIQCEGQNQPLQCRPDGCNQCQLEIFNALQVKQSRQTCRARLDLEMKRMCAKVKCPQSSQRASCPPRPSCYPEDWALDCVVDPCACRSLWMDQDVRTNVSPSCARSIAAPCVKPEDCPKDFECSDISPEALARMDQATRSSLICVQEPCTCRPVSMPLAMLPPGFRLPCKGPDCCEDGQGPAVCPPQLQAASCAALDCGNVRIGTCVTDGCNKCAIKVTDQNNKLIPPAMCRLVFNESAVCPGVRCPPMTGPPQCGSKPSECPSDWKLRCIRDPCVCTRSIWIDEDVRIAEPACTAALQPPCATTCPAQFSCPGLAPPLRCIQEPCTCRPVVDPASIPRAPMPGQPGMMPPPAMPPG